MQEIVKRHAVEFRARVRQRACDIVQDAFGLFGLHFAFSDKAVLGSVEGVLVEIGEGDLYAGEVGFGEVVAGTDTDVEMLAFAEVLAEPGEGVVGDGACPGVGGNDAKDPPVVDDEKPGLTVDGCSASTGFGGGTLRRGGFGVDAGLGSSEGSLSEGRGRGHGGLCCRNGSERWGSQSANNTVGK